MTKAVEEFFPDSDVLEKDTADVATSDSGPYPLHRLSTSIVGENNGTRPGGYVLVIDGTALGHVCVLCMKEF